MRKCYCWQNYLESSLLKLMSYIRKETYYKHNSQYCTTSYANNRVLYYSKNKSISEFVSSVVFVTRLCNPVSWRINML